MRSAVVGVVLGLSCGLAQGQDEVERAPMLETRRMTPFAQVDALPSFPRRTPSLRASIPSGVPAIGRNGFGFEVPSPRLPSLGESVRLGGPGTFGVPTLNPTLPRFDVNVSRFDPRSVLSGGLGGISRGLFGEKKGRHSSLSLPFLDSRNAGDLTHKIEAVKIAEHVLRKLNDAPPGAAGGFTMMKFLYKLIKRVSRSQKGTVTKLLVLITVPYAATLAISFWMGPTTAMDLTWPGAKKGIVKVLETILKKYGRIGGAANIQSYANQLRQGVSHLDNLPGQVSRFPGRVSSLPAGAIRNVSGQARRLGRSAQPRLPSTSGGASARLDRLH